MSFIWNVFSVVCLICNLSFSVFSKMNWEFNSLFSVNTFAIIDRIEKKKTCLIFSKCQLDPWLGPSFYFGPSVEFDTTVLTLLQHYLVSVLSRVHNVSFLIAWRGCCNFNSSYWHICVQARVWRRSDHAYPRYNNVLFFCLGNYQVCWPYHSCTESIIVIIT